MPGILRRCYRSKTLGSAGNSQRAEFSKRTPDFPPDKGNYRGSGLRQASFKASERTIPYRDVAGVNV